MIRDIEIEKARAVLHNSERVLVLTGAGISAESGVPTFRGGGGAAVWRGMPFEVLSSAAMVEKDLPLVWEWFDYRRSKVRDCKPNAGHIAIAETAKNGLFLSFILVTQNIDGLHAAAGSTDLIELHGNIHQARCLSCRHLQNLAEMGEDERPPVCSECLDSMRPDVVLFGEMLENNAVAAASEASAKCDVCLVVGTSALVSPANTFPEIAKAAGAFLIEVNPEPTALTAACDISLRGLAAETLPKLFEQELGIGI